MDGTQIHEVEQVESCVDICENSTGGGGEVTVDSVVWSVPIMAGPTVEGFDKTIFVLPLPLASSSLLF